jgi:o-succinylbenzoate synthase
MRIDGIVLRELGMRLKHPFETSTEVTWNRRVLLVEALSEGVRGWGEITAEEGPFYNPEFTDGAWEVVRQFIVPAILGKTIQQASDVALLLARIRGHEMARGGVECAFWDVEARQRNVPLAQLMGGTRTEIPCGVSIGIHQDASVLLAQVARELDAGYQRIKLKIRPGADLTALETVRREFGEILLMADANSAYSLADVEHLKQFDAFNLMMIEQPLAWDDIYDHSLLQPELKTPICLDESIHNAQHAQAALALGACRIINIKLGRVGGFSGARKVHDLCHAQGIPVWCGGMLESGIGRAHNIALSTLPGFTLPGDVSASQRYWDTDIVEPEILVSARGTIAAPSGPGLGYNIRHDLIARLTAREEAWRA